MAVVIPPVLRHAVVDDETGPAWLESIPELVARAIERWGLVVGDPFETGMAAWTAPATTSAGDDVVLKLSFPHDEAREEADALAAWHGSGAVELLGSDPAGQALLLRRLRPGSNLTDAALPVEEHLDVGIEILCRLAAVDVPPGAPFQDLVVVTAGFADRTEERIERVVPRAPYPVDAGVCRQAVELLRTLAASADRIGLAHGDLNPGNILCRSPASADRDALEWLAIDPKPVHGDLAYDPWPLLTQIGDWVDRPASPEELAERTRLVASATDLDAARIASWGTARSVVSGLWAADRGWWTGFRGADGDLARASAWARAATVLGP